MKLLVMRHAEAEALRSTDFARQLTARGLQQAGSAGQWLAENGFHFDRALLSPFQRTRDTAKAVLASLPGVPFETASFLLSDTPPSEAISALAAYQAEHQPESLLLISHQPLVSLLLAKLCDETHMTMAPASMALVDTELIATACCQLSWLRHAPLFDRS